MNRKQKDTMAINLKDLTLGQLDELRALFNLPTSAPTKFNDNGAPV